MAGNKVDVSDAHPDFVSEDEADQLTDNGSDGTEEEEEEGRDDEPRKKSPADKKAPAKKSDSEEEEDDEGEEEGEEEEDDKPDTEVEKLRRKLGRAGAARERLEAQVRELQERQRKIEEQQSETGKKRLEKMTEELDELYQKVEDLRAEGKTGEAAKAQRRIDEIRDSMTRAQSAAYATQQALQQTELRAFNAMVAELAVFDSRFDPDSDEFDEEANDEVNELVEAYEAKGMSMTEALRKAVKAVLREDPFGKGARKSLARQEKDKKPDPKKTDVKKNIAAEKKQPPDEPGAKKERASTLDVETMSEEEFDALPESKKRELRGDLG